MLANDIARALLQRERWTEVSGRQSREYLRQLPAQDWPHHVRQPLSVAKIVCLVPAVLLQNHVAAAEAGREVHPGQPLRPRRGHVQHGGARVNGAAVLVLHLRCVQVRIDQLRLVSDTREVHCHRLRAALTGVQRQGQRERALANNNVRENGPPGRRYASRQVWG